MSKLYLPAVSSETSFMRYLQEIRQFPSLSFEEEQNLAKNWEKKGDIDAAHRLVTSHLKLVAKIASGFNGYGLPLMELVAEGNIGLMQAVKRFKAQKGFRLSTYAMWWIKASIQEYILRSWSLVRIGTTAAQRTLFFNLRKLKQKLGIVDSSALTMESTKKIADTLKVSEKEVDEMHMRMTHVDCSLDDVLGHEEDEGPTLLEQLTGPEETHEYYLAEKQETLYKKDLLAEGLDRCLNIREKDIIMQRRLIEQPVTLDVLSEKYSISRERVRQIEAQAFIKLQKHLTQALPA